MSTLRERARGRWDEILTTLFNVDQNLLNPRRHHACPSCGGVDRFRYKGDEDGGYFCGSHRGDGIDLIMHLTGLNFRDVASRIEELVGKDVAPIERPKAPWGEMLAKAQPLKRSMYLESRGITETHGLLGVRAAKYRDGEETLGVFPAILAPIKRQGKIIGMQVLYLKDGAKAPVPAPKKTLSMPGKTINGGAVELRPFKGGWLGIAEGFETALSAGVLHDMPVWAALSTSGLKSWDWPKNVEGIIIFADNDEKLGGHAAAWHLAHRIACAGVPVEVRMPEEPGTDWNDVLKERKCKSNT